MIQYETVFDVIETGYRYWWCVIVFSACFGAIVLDQIKTTRFIPDLDGPLKRGNLYILLTVGGSLAFIFFLLTFPEYYGLRSALRQGKIGIVEGKVENFVPMPYKGHAVESFTVSGKRFEYSDYMASPGFRQTASHGGPIREDLNVRVFFLDSLIARLDVAK